MFYLRASLSISCKKIQKLVACRKLLLSQRKLTHNVVTTSMTVRLTWTTMSRYFSVNLFTIWLKDTNIAVGRVTWYKR